MALSVFLRSSSRIKVFPSLLRTSTFPLNSVVNSRKAFSQVLSQTSFGKNAAVSSKSKINFLVPKRDMSGDHSKLWAVEKVVAIALLGVVPATFMYPNLVLDNIFAVLVVAHIHWGLEACIADYVRPIIFGPIIPNLTMGLLYMISALTLGGLLYYNHNYMGIGCTGCKLWQIKK